MKKCLVYLFATALVAVPFASCSDDDEPKNPEESPANDLEESYFTIEDATYNGGAFPSATTDVELSDIDMSTQVMNGAMNYISVITEKTVRKFFVGVKGIEGFWEYVPQQEVAERATADTEYHTYVIPVMMSLSYNGNSVVVVSGELENGDVTIPVEKEVTRIETKTGAIEVKLAFSNDKDIDLHLFTPSGQHIFYGEPGGIYWTTDGDTIGYGLDIDSNAGCDIDGIDKENIYIPVELVENGTYTVVVDMYNNCDPSIPTSWSIVARYQGDLITPATGRNPASGVYPVGANNGDMTQVMTFTISNAATNRTAGHKRIIRNSFKPRPFTDAERMKIKEAAYRSGK